MAKNKQMYDIKFECLILCLIHTRIILLIILIYIHIKKLMDFIKNLINVYIDIISMYIWYYISISDTTIILK